MVCKLGNLTVKETPGNFDIDNGRVLLRLFLRDGGYVQELYAIDQSGTFQAVLSSLHKNLIAASEHRIASSPMISGERPHLFGINRESLRMVYSKVEVVDHTEQRVVVSLEGSVQDHSLKCYMTIQDGANHVHVSVEDEIAADDGPPLVEYLMSSYAFLPGLPQLTVAKPLDYTWAPIMRPGKDHVVGDCVFNSPAAIVQQGAFAAAIIPDLDVLSKNRPMPAALDLDLTNGLLFAPLISYGFCGYEPTPDNRYCKHDITMAHRLDPPHLKYAYDLYLSASCRKKYAHSEVAKLLWRRYGAKAIRESLNDSYSQASNSESKATPARKKDVHTEMTFHSGWDILRAARESLKEYESTGSKKHLDQGLRHLDQISLLQCVWHRSWETNAPPPGILASSNLGLSYDAVLTAEFGRCALRYGTLTGEKYYFERGIAAMRAALTIEGLDSDSKAKIRACAKAVKTEYGSIFIHIGKKWGACTADSRIKKLDISADSISLILHPHTGPNGHRRIVFGGMRRKSYRVRIDGCEQSFAREEMAEGITLPEQ